MEQQFDRFKDLPWFRPDLKPTVIIGGAGGIGSYLALLLARMGTCIYIYDFDTVSETNIGGQLFSKASIGETKVSALNATIRSYADSYLNTYYERFTENSIRCPYMFSAFDNMEARRIMFDRWKSGNYKKGIFIDGRLIAESLQIFCVTRDNMDIYEQEYLFSDSEVEDAPCTMKQTSHSAAMIASHMVGFFTNHLTNVYEESKVRDVPLLYEFFIPATFTEVLT